jgi:acyl dehydratase
MASRQVYFEDVEVGSEIPQLEKEPTTQQLVKYAGASGDYYQIHYDKDFALKNNLPGVIIHGALKNAFLGQLMTDFAGELGWLRKLSVQYRGMDQPIARYGLKATKAKRLLRAVQLSSFHPGTRDKRTRAPHARWMLIMAA